MHTIQPARVKAGTSLADIVDHSRDAATAGDDRLIRGKALIFWDKKSATPKKLDAIDTDQITPAADCVSESLDTLDERWKAGSFRYLMPDFRARVHRGETFVVAGDRFAIGSSREMSPAGLKAVAEEAGLEMVIVCGDGMGDISREDPIANRSPAMRKVSPACTRFRNSGIRCRNAPVFQRSSRVSRLSETQSSAGVIWSVSIASSFFR